MHLLLLVNKAKRIRVLRQNARSGVNSTTRMRERVTKTMEIVELSHYYSRIHKITIEH